MLQTTSTLKLQKYKVKKKQIRPGKESMRGYSGIFNDGSAKIDDRLLVTHPLPLISSSRGA